MKTLNFIFTVLFSLGLGMNSFAQTHDQSNTVVTKTETIKVWGNCNMCKARIEKAAKVEGVSKSKWDKETKILKLVYDPSKANSDDIQKKIAAVGHDTEKFTADDNAYKSLPACCHYDRKK